MDLAAFFAEDFEDLVRERGEDTVDRGCVVLEHVAADWVRARVRGTEEYGVELVDHGGGRWSFVCSCQAFAKFGPCKHLWATILAVDDLEATESATESAAEGDASRSRRGARRRSPGAGSAGAPAGAVWREVLGQLQRFSGGPPVDPWSEAGVRGDEWTYLLDVSGTLSGQRAMLTALRRRRLKNGSWGKAKPVHPYRDLEALPSAPEIEAARALHAGAQEPWENTVDVASPGEYGIDIDVAVPILWKLGESGRLALVSIDGAGEPLVVDRGPPWVPLLVVVTNADGSGQLVGRLQRGEVRLSLDDPLLLLGAGLVVFADRIARFDPGGGLDWALALRQSGPLEIPAEDMSDFRRSLIEDPPPLALEQPDLESRPLCRPRAVLDVRTLELPPSWQQNWGRDVLAATIGFDYDGLLIGCGDTRRQLVHPADGRVVERDFETESACLRRISALGGKPTRGGDAWDAEVSPRDLPELVTALVDDGWTVTAEGVRHVNAGATTVSVRTGIDWFELEGSVAFEGQQVELPALLAAVRDGRRNVVLDDGSVGVLPRQWLEQWGWIEGVAEAHEGGLRVAQSRGWMLDALLAARPDVGRDEEFRAFSQRLASFAGLRPRRERKSFAGTLRGYQREALGWFAALRELGFGGCLADDMGLGKTVQVLAMLESRRHARPRPAPSLVVAPRSVASNWIREAAHFTPGLRVADLSGPDRGQLIDDLEHYHLAVTSYGLLRRDIERLATLTFDYVILDESQAIKNDKSQSAKAARLLVADHRLALSGTPIENHLGELWSLFEFLNPGMLGHGKVFQQLVKGGDTDAWDASRWELLSRALRPFILRRTKDEVLKELPSRTEQVLLCEPSQRERREYEALRDHYREALLTKVDAQGLGGSGIHVLEGLLRLRQAACHPGLIDRARVDEPSAKLDVLLESLVELRDEGHKALVFSQFTSLLDIVARRLKSAGIRWTRLDGRTRKRAERVQEFQDDPELSVFLISLKAGGLGLNLTAADYVFLLDPWWNPAVERQAIDRSHRMGQKRPVTAYRLVCPGTVEERILELQDRKRELADAVLGKGAFTLRDLSRDDLAWLLS